MTEDEIREFIRSTMDTDYRVDTDAIVARWMEDKQIAVDEAHSRGQHSMHPF